MRQALIVISLIMGLVLAGCAGPSQPPAEGPSAPSAPDTGEPSAPPPSAPDDGGAADDAAEDTTEDTTEEPVGSSEYSGMDWASLMGLGVALMCDVTETSAGASVTARIYLDTSDNFRYEVPVEDTEETGCSKFIIIKKDKTMYMGCDSGKYPPGTSCDWMSIEAAEDSELETEFEYGSGGGFDTDYSDVPAANINCGPWVVDPSMFVASGKSCTFEDLAEGYSFG